VPILNKITDSAGEYHLLPLRQLPPAEMAKLVARFIDQTARHYNEIIENCEINFTKEIEFETFRRNFTYEEAEEIRIEYEKIVGWFERVSKRDWFGAPNREATLGWLERCRRLLEGFEAQVFRTYAAAGEHQGSSPESSARRSGRRRWATSLSSAALRVVGAPPDEAEGPEDADIVELPEDGASLGDGGVPAADDAV
jgi:hypothetical protein